MRSCFFFLRASLSAFFFNRLARFSSLLSNNFCNAFFFSASPSSRFRLRDDPSPLRPIGSLLVSGTEQFATLPRPRLPTDQKQKQNRGTLWQHLLGAKIA